MRARSFFTIIINSSSFRIRCRMRVRAFQFFACCFCFGVTSAVCPDDDPANTRSHMERFSTPQARAERAEIEASEKLKTQPNDPESLNARAYARMGLGHYAEAVEDLRRAVTLNPKKADYQANLGYALWKMGRRAEALNAEREASSSTTKTNCPLPTRPLPFIERRSKTIVRSRRAFAARAGNRSAPIGSSVRSADRLPDSRRSAKRHRATESVAGRTSSRSAGHLC